MYFALASESAHKTFEVLPRFCVSQPACVADVEFVLAEVMLTCWRGHKL